MCKRAVPNSLARALTLAVSEWILMFMLFIDAFFSYLVTRFASYRDLQVPCMICSRLDHILSDEKEGFYWDFMCENHKFEISSLVVSHIHNKSNYENYRLLVGKMGSIPHAEDYDLGTSFGSKASELDESSSSLKVDCSRNNNRMAIINEAPASNRISAPTHVESRKVKLYSDADTESDVPFSNEDIVYASALKRERDSPINQSYLQVDSSTVVATTNDLVFEKFIPLDTVLQVKEISKPHGCEELNRIQKEEDISQISTIPELISFDEVSPSPNITETPDQVSTHSLDAPGAGEMRSLDTNSGVNTNRLQISNSLDLGDAYKLATKGRQLSGKLLEQRSLQDSARVSEDLKLLLSQLSFSRGFELSLNDLSPNPKVSWNGEEIKSLDTSTSSIGMNLLLQRRISLERNDSGLSLDGSIYNISDIDGESVLDRLKRQVEHDKKIMNGLYKELEEERNASAVSAYQAMAMITRLQEEKAALHMEALQCLRMMEEQAEYDGEALQRANDLVAQKEKELLDMETKLHLYQNASTNLRT